MRKRQLLGIVSVFGMAILASGCITSTGQDSTKILSERQQQILKEENLPTDYEKLTVSQNTKKED